MNIANKVTMSRLVLTVVFVALGSFDNATMRWCAYFAGAAACISDFFDGYLARKLNLVSDFGKLMDPLADKIFVTAAFILLSAGANPAIPAWISVVVLSREIAVTGLRMIALQEGNLIEAGATGKLKAVVQFVYLGFAGLLWASGLSWNADFGVAGYFIQFLMYVTLVLTVYSGYEYFAKNKDLYMKSL